MTVALCLGVGIPSFSLNEFRTKKIRNAKASDFSYNEVYVLNLMN